MKQVSIIGLRLPLGMMAFSLNARLDTTLQTRDQLVFAKNNQFYLRNMVPNNVMILHGQE
jgi:hypothetical protein